MIGKLKEAELAAALKAHPQWEYDAERSAFCRDFLFRDFSEAFAVMTRVAMEAEKADHHPEWANVYNRLTIRLTTHEAKGVSKRDVAMMAAIDEMVRD